jgi:hypothetical protein
LVKVFFSKKSLKELLKDEFCHTDTKPKAQKTMEKSGFMPMARVNIVKNWPSTGSEDGLKSSRARQQKKRICKIEF